MNEGPSRLEEIAPEKLSAQQSAVLEAVVRGRGFVPKPFKIWLHSPELAKRIEALGTWLSASSSLSSRELEIAVVVVAQRLASPFVLDAHVRALTKAGHPASAVDALREGRVPELATARERAVYEIARTANDPSPASDEIFAQAVEALGRDGLADLVAMIGYDTAVGVAMKLHRVPVEAR